MICIAWIGMGSYAECAVAQFAKDTEEEIRLIAVTSDVPKVCADKIAGVPVIWITSEDRRTLKDLLGEVPRILVTSGWYLDLFHRYTAEVHAAGGKNIALSDNPFHFSFKLIVWIVYFNLKVRLRYDAFMASGSSAYRLLRWAGVPKKLLGSGIYPCNLELFTNGGDLALREKKIVYVGRYIPVKNILPFLQVYAEFSKAHPDWSLDMYGQGPQEEEVRKVIADSGCRSVTLHPFAKPVELAGLYKRVRALVLPSVNDHWGVVVQEAAASGCALLVSTGVRSADDFCSKKNACCFAHDSKVEMRAALERMAAWSDTEWHEAQAESLRLSHVLTPKTFSDQLRGLISRLGG